VLPPPARCRRRGRYRQRDCAQTRRHGSRPARTPQLMKTTWPRRRS